ncbi:MAG TPA: TraB/GumN family protein, partial [Nitrospiraceae bacterium]|nr:TraB/GumN family protein [Nitrospiraceae bacterium]
KHEFENGAALMSFFASMPPRVQSQYIEMLLDFLDDEKRGSGSEYLRWVEGQPSTRALDRMRSKTPELYSYLQADRNIWWAKHIEALLAQSGTRFVLLGMNHVLGPEGVPAQLAKLKVELTALHA